MSKPESRYGQVGKKGTMEGLFKARLQKALDNIPDERRGAMSDSPLDVRKTDSELESELGFFPKRLLSVSLRKRR